MSIEDIIRSSLSTSVQAEYSCLKITQVVIDRQAFNLHLVLDKFLYNRTF